MFTRTRDQWLFLPSLCVILFVFIRVCFWDIKAVDKWYGIDDAVAQMPAASLPSALVQDHFCVSWGVNTDEWWTHHPEWDVAEENRTHTCFARYNNADSRYRMAIYENQWKSNCSDRFVWKMWSSGFGADISNLAEGIIYGEIEHKPFVVTFKGRIQWWHYAAKKQDGTNATCVSRDIGCYFLPIGKCSGTAEEVGKYKNKIRYNEIPRFYSKMDFVASSYVGRQQQWLRKAVYEYSERKAPKLTSGCTVMHVRRADVILHKQVSRKYFPVSDYINALPMDRRDNGATILLLTDDQNAIEEAHEFYPKINWRYFSRPRFRGKEGGWENQIPSGNPKLEVIVLLSTFKIVKQCDVLVHGKSGFANALYSSMVATDKKIERFEIGTKKRAFGSQHNSSDVDLAKTLDQQRRSNSTVSPSSLKS